MTDETRSLSDVRIDDRRWGSYLDIPLACPRNRERYTGFIEFLTLDNTERSVFALLLVLLVLGDHLIPALTPLSRVCLELVSAVKQRHRALTEKRYTREQRL